MLMKVAVMKLRAGTIEVFPRGMLKSARMLVKKRSLGDCPREEVT